MPFEIWSFKDRFLFIHSLYICTYDLCSFNQKSFLDILYVIFCSAGQSNFFTLSMIIIFSLIMNIWGAKIMMSSVHWQNL